MVYFLHKFFLTGILLCLSLSALQAQKYTFEWQVGTEVGGEIQFSNPDGLALNNQGDVYVADLSNSRIIKCNAHGEVTSKLGTYGTGDGQFQYPSDVAIDALDNIYVADRFNNRIQKFAANGEFLMKFGTYGSEPGQFIYPTAAAVDGEGNIYVADPRNNRIQKFSKDGVFIGMLGSTTPGTADGQFNSPGDLLIDKSGNIYVADTGNDRIQKFDKNGAFLKKYSTINQRTSGTRPVSLAINSQGYIYVTCLYGLPMQVFYPDGQTSAFISNEPSVSQIQYPVSIAIDAQDNVYLADQRNNIVQKFNMGAMPLWQLGAGSAAGQFRGPSGVATDAAGNVYVADRENTRIQKFNSKGLYLSSIKTKGMPYDVALDTQGNMYVVHSSVIGIYKPNGQYTSFGSYGNSEGQFDNAAGVAVDKFNNIYVVDRNQNSVQKFDASGAFIWRKQGTDSWLNQPTDVTTDTQGNVYIVNLFGESVLKLDADGKYLMNLVVGSMDKRLFEDPTDVAVDKEGKIYVADKAKVQVFTADGYQLSSIQTATNIDESRYYYTKVAVDAAGNVYVSDDQSNTLQKYTYTRLPKVSVLGQIGEETAIIEDNTGSFSFGTTTVGTPVTRTFVIDNISGMADLILGGLSLPAGFTLASYFPATVPVGDQKLFEVQMIANQVGNSGGTLSFTSNDPERNPYNFTISGKVVAQTVVTKLNQTVTFNALPDKTYDDPAFRLSATTTSSLPVTFRIVSGPAFIDEENNLIMAGAGKVTVSASQAGNDAYNKAADVEHSFMVNKASQAITFEALPDKTIGDAPFTIWAASSMNLPVSFSVVSGPATLKGNVLTLIGTGVVTLKATQEGNANVSAAEVSQSFRIHGHIAKKSQTITFEAIEDKIYTNIPFSISATASSSLPVSFTIVSGPATLTGNTLTLTGAGTVIIKAYQWGNDTYDAAREVEHTFMVNKASQTLTLASIADQTLSSTPVELTSTTSAGLQATIEVVSGPATLTGNSLTLTGQGIVTIKAVQNGNENYLAAEEVSTSFCVFSAKPVITANGVVLTSSSAEGNQWYMNGVALTGATAQTFHALEAGEYSLQVTGPCGSAQVSEVFQVSVSGVNEDLAAVVKLYPNPATIFTILQLPANVTCQRISILSSTGSTVMQFPVPNLGNEITIPTQSLAKGLYILQVETTKGLVTKKVSILN